MPLENIKNSSGIFFRLAGYMKCIFLLIYVTYVRKDVI